MVRWCHTIASCQYSSNCDENFCVLVSFQDRMHLPFHGDPAFNWTSGTRQRLLLLFLIIVGIDSYDIFLVAKSLHYWFTIFYKQVCRNWSRNVHPIPLSSWHRICCSTIHRGPREEDLLDRVHRLLARERRRKTMVSCLVDQQKKTKWVYFYFFCFMLQIVG